LKFLSIIFRAVPAVLCSLFLSIILILEILNFTTNHYKKEEYIKELIEEIEQEKKLFGSSKAVIHPTDLVQEKKKNKYVLYENYIVDIGNFMPFHPGGMMAIEDYLYTDVGRYLTGTQAYNKNFKPHSHKYSTFKHVITSLAYAELRDNHRLVTKSFGIIDSNPRSSNDLFKISEADSTYINESSLVLLETTVVANSTFEYKFHAKNFLFAKFLPGVFWIGRHFSISSEKANKTRYYTICLSMDKKMKEKHLKLLENVNKLEKAEKIEDLALKDHEMANNSISVYIKHYTSKNALSDHIFNLTPGQSSDLIIRGPVVNQIFNLHTFYTFYTF
jgi:hypothetical protein